jgi:hypothetical protein
MWEFSKWYFDASPPSSNLPLYTLAPLKFRPTHPYRHLNGPSIAFHKRSPFSYLLTMGDTLTAPKSTSSLRGVIAFP